MMSLSGATSTLGKALNGFYPQPGTVLGDLKLIFNRPLQWKPKQHFQMYNYSTVFDFTFLVADTITAANLGVFGQAIAFKQSLAGKSDILCKTAPMRSIFDTVGCDCFSDSVGCFSKDISVPYAQLRSCYGSNSSIATQYVVKLFSFNFW